MRETRTNKGITLIALIITIIVLLILAIVSIRLVVNNGILGKAESAVDQYGTAEEQEQIKIGYADYQMAQASGKSENLTVAGANVTGNGPWAVEFSKTGNIYAVSTDGKTITSTSSTEESEVKSSIEWASAGSVSNSTNKILNANENTKLKDEYGNKIVVPAGFQIKVDKDNTNNATHVTEGIVVTDGTNEFVWIPVGNIKTSTTDTTGTQITLGRYGVYNSNTSKWEGFEVGATPVQTIANYSEQVEITSSSGNKYTEDTSSNHTGTNAIANDIYAFLSSAESNGGYYLGRYEAREKGNTTTDRTDSSSQTSDVVCNKENIVYNYITQPNASLRCQGMYTGKPFTSDLINSYAWDTAIMFIENFSDNSSYASNKSVNTNYANKGTDADKISNIYDMASNCWELTTETYSLSDYHCTPRGGYYGNNTYYASGRDFSSTTRSSKFYSFRPLLYM